MLSDGAPLTVFLNIGLPKRAPLSVEETIAR